jgi:hypothetical protein
MGWWKVDAELDPLQSDPPPRPVSVSREEQLRFQAARRNSIVTVR